MKAGNDARSQEIDQLGGKTTDGVSAFRRLIKCTRREITFGVVRIQKGDKTMIAKNEKNESTEQGEEMQGQRIKVGKLQRDRETVRELTPGERKRIKGGVVISIIGILVGGASAAPAVRKQQ